MKKKSGSGREAKQPKLLHNGASTRLPDVTIAFRQALAHHQAGRLAEAENGYTQILKAHPGHFDSLHLLGVIFHQRGNHLEAVRQIDAALKINPKNSSAYSNRGAPLQALKRFDDALASYDKAIALKPDFEEAFYNRGNVLKELKRFDDAIASYDKALALRPDYVDAFYNRGLAWHELRRFDEAVVSYDRTIALNPGFAEAYNNRGVALQELKRLDEALASYDKAVALKPDYADAFSNRGVLLLELKMPVEALASCDKAIALKPDYADAYNNRCLALQNLERFDEALASCDRALALKLGYAEAFYNRGNALQKLKRFDEAVASYDKAIALRPDYAHAFSNRGVALKELKRFDEALASYGKALALKPDNAHAFSGLAECVNATCDWQQRKQIADEVIAHVREKKSVISPFVLLAYSGDPALQLQCAKNYIENQIPLLPRPIWAGTAWAHDRPRIAYLSADFHASATAHLIAELFERHDRSRFEIVGISFGIDDHSQMRKRLIASFDRFYDVRGKSDEDVARFIHDLQIDIAVDLKGHTTDSRPAILAHRPAPIQASYLGYPGTMGAPFIDYIIADEIVAPFEHQPFFTECIVHLPGCYQVNDGKREIAKRTPARREVGLPETSFVFCCFNNNWKITPEVFDVWMRLLQAVEDSVLWLLRDNESAERNLRQEAQQRGIDPSRLIFAGRLPADEHLARHRLADLFLDTVPVNAHTTASDALWAGLPVITLLGEAFAGRVAASLLQAVGLPELVTQNIKDYEALALRLANDTASLKAYRTRLDANRLTYPLFDADHFRRGIEAAYLRMLQIGEKAHSFKIEGPAGPKGS